MQLGMVGLGRMGAGMTERLRRAGHDVKTYDPNVESTAGSLAELAQQLDPPRHVWMMVPAGEVTESTFRELVGILEAGDAIVDGGNSNFRDSQRRAAEAGERSLFFLDVGVSGGIWGLQEGFALMAGGEAEPVGRLVSAFEALAPEGGFAHVGPSGAGHFVKMVHNGIEYGVMAAYAEGLNILRNADVGSTEREADAETAPLDHPEHYQYELDIPEVTELWRRGSVIGSWLLDLTAQALQESPDLSDYEGRVSDSGEGRWTSIAAIEEGVPAPVLSMALYSRFASRGLD
ncbi:MAG TPA: decarboxylating 6-phosphogluconate dehydrogenase, partial [Gaiellaceae bacterium]|nr:decarboxylating 6-phosphogluconate dehydrogenase [Gaiellaceae bacterium]